MFLLVALGWVKFPPVHDALHGVTIRLSVPLVVYKPSKLLDGLIGTISSLDPADEKKGTRGQECQVRDFAEARNQGNTG
jgi:hypothetical protein